MGYLTLVLPRAAIRDRPVGVREPYIPNSQEKRMYTAFDHSLPQAQTSRRDGSRIGTKQTGLNQMKITGLNSSCTVVFLACICLIPAAYADGVRSAIEAANAQFSAAAAKGDGAGLAALYSKEGQVMPAGSDPIRGTDAIQKFWQGALDSGIAGVGLKTIEVYGHGPTATEVGEYELRDKAGKVLDHGKYIVVWQRADGKWQLLRDMFSTNVPPPKK